MDIKRYINIKKERGVYAPFSKLGKMGFLPLIREYDKICISFLESYMEGDPNKVLHFTLLELNRVIDDAFIFGVEEGLKYYTKKFSENPKKATLDSMYMSDMLGKNSKRAVLFSCEERLSYIFSKTLHAFGSTDCLDEWFERFIIDKEEIVGMGFADTKWNTLIFRK